VLKRERRDRVIHAWHVAAFVGLSKPPPLEKILADLDPPPPRPAQDPGEIMRIMDLWRIAYSATMP
jgi:hypothetical protein